MRKAQSSVKTLIRRVSAIAEKTSFLNSKRDIKPCEKQGEKIKGE